jgi:manganese transport protein
LWALAEVAIAATDLAEVIGSAIALNLLFGLPMAIGVVLTSADVLLVLHLQQHSFRYVEALVVLLIAGIAGCFAIELAMTRPNLFEVARGVLPTTEMFRNREMLYIAAGILGATVMPHNLYLHSSIVQTRKYGNSEESRGEAMRFSTLDTVVALMSALFINGAILIVSSASFHCTGYDHIADISDAYKLLAPLLGTTLASTLFAVALLCSGHNGKTPAMVYLFCQ